MLKACEFWLSLGVALVPCQPGSKHIIAGFGAHQQHVSDLAGVRFWFGDRRCNLAVVCGGAAGLVVLDFDDVGSYERWRGVAGALAGSLTESTRRGYHVFLLAGGDLAGGLGDGCEIKTGGAVVVSPSRVGGVTYQVINPGAGVLLVERAALPPSFLSEKPVIATHLEKRGSDGDLVSRCKQSLDILQVAQGLQTMRGLPALRERRGRPGWWVGRCPFHDENTPSYFVNTEKGFFLCRACGARGDVLNLYQVLHGHSGIQETIREVARCLG